MTKAPKAPKAPPALPPPRLYLLTPVLAEAAAFAPALEAALDAAEVACVLVRLATTDEGTAKKILKTLAPVVQTRDAALLVEQAPGLAARAGADGVNLRCSGETLIPQLEEAIDSLKPERIVGVGGVKSKHDAMSAGELDIDYVMFGDPAPDGYTPPAEQTLERVTWWADIFNVPSIGYAARLEDIAPLVAAGADFIALGSCIWDDPRGPAAAVTDAAGIMSTTPRPAA